MTFPHKLRPFNQGDGSAGGRQHFCFLNLTSTIFRAPVRSCPQEGVQLTVTLTMSTSGCSQLYTWHDVAIVATFISTLLITYLSLTGLFGETNSEVCVLNLNLTE